MIVDRYEPVNLFELVPSKLRLEMEPQLAALDRLLDDDEIFLRIKADFSKRRPNSQRLGRRSTPVEVILRMLVLRRLYDWSFEATERHVSDSLVLRQFTRLYLEPAPDDTTLIRWANLIGPKTLEHLNERVVALACQRKLTRGRKLRTDATVVETNIPHPTDSALLSDGVRVLSRLVGRAKGLLEASGELFRNRTRSAKRLARRIEQGARRRGEEAKEALKGTYGRLIGVAKASLKQAGEVRQMLPPEARRGLGVEFEHFEGLLERVVEQTQRRVLKGQSVAAGEKLVSIFEEHTSIIRRGKVGKETEYGHKVWLEETEGAIISGYRVLEGNPADRDQLLPALEHHQQRFGKPPRLVAADRGVYWPENERECQKRGVERVCLPKPGKKSQQRREHERQGWFRGGCALGRGSRGASACPSAGGFWTDAGRRGRKASVDG
jgi:transposase, IS5 family